MKNYKYQELYDQLERGISQGEYEVGDKLPSLRFMANNHGLSIQTVMTTYHKLEENGLIKANERSGYSILDTPNNKSYIDNQTSCNGKLARPLDDIELLENFFEHSNNEKFVNLGSLIPHPSFFNKTQVNGEIRKILNQDSGSFFNYGEPQGNKKFKKFLLNKYAKNKSAERDCFTTNGTLNSIFLALSAVCKPGDVVAIESPIYFGFKFMLESLGVKTLSIKSLPHTGMTVEQLKRVYKKNKFKAIILISSFSNPTGALVSNDEKEKIVRLAEDKKFFIMEDDVYGELHFNKQRPHRYLDYDKTGKVFYCNSVSKIISPALKVGWLIIPKEYTRKINILKLGQLGAISPALEEVAKNLLKSKKIQLKIRRSAKTYQENISKVQHYFKQYGDGKFKTSNPQGGFCLWIEGPAELDSLDLYSRLLEDKIVIAPGALFSTSGQFNNFFRLNCAFEDFSAIKKSLLKIIELASL